MGSPGTADAMADLVQSQFEDNTPPVTPASAEPSRAGGLLRPRPKEMTPVFTVLMTVLFLDVPLILLLPFLIAAHTDSPWGDVPRVGFLGLSVWSGIVFGTLASVVAERRNHSAWWFLAGHLGAVAAIPLAAAGMAETAPLTARLIVFGVGMAGTLAAFVIVQAYPRGPSEPGPLTHALGRMWHAAGNIWFGITLMIILAAAWHQGTWWENAYGHKSAGHVFYSSWWYGLLQLTFSSALISATLRKYPWRIEQTGWIVTHIALTMLLIGSFMSYFGKREGMLGLKEGEATSVFSLDDETRLQVFEIRKDRAGPVRIWSEIATFDVDPSDTEVEQSFDVADASGSLFDIHVDRYYGDGIPRSQRANDSDVVSFAVEGELRLPNGQGMPFDLVADDPDRATLSMQVLSMGAIGLRWPAVGRSLRQGTHEIDVGTIVVTDAEGKELLRQTLKPGARPEGVPQAPASIDDLDVAIPGTKVKMKGLAWFDNFAIRSGMDMTPGLPRFPAIMVTLSGDKGEERRTALAYVPSWSDAPSALGAYKDLRVHFEYLPSFPLEPGELVLAYHPDEAPFWVMVKNSGERMSGPIEEGKPLELGIPLEIIPTTVFTHMREWLTWDFNAHDPERQVARMEIDGKSHWLRLGGKGTTIEKDSRQFRVRWWKSEQELGFKLTLRDFHRDFYPGRREARTFESYLWLEHPTKLKESGDHVGIKIDMNHPLRLDGWRLFQARFSEGDREETFLQVNRDPGLSLIYPACVVLLLGLVIVFTQKRHFLKALAKYVKRRDAAPGTRFVAATIVVLLAFLATAPGVMMIVLTPEGPLLGVGVLLIVLGLSLETLWVNTWLRQRLDRPPAKTGSAP